MARMLDTPTWRRSTIAGSGVRFCAVVACMCGGQADMYVCKSRDICADNVYVNAWGCVRACVSCTALPGANLEEHRRWKRRVFAWVTCA